MHKINIESYVFLIFIKKKEMFQEMSLYLTYLYVQNIIINY